MKAYQDYELLEEEFRHLIAVVHKDNDGFAVPILEHFVNEGHPVPPYDDPRLLADVNQIGYGVVSVITSEPRGFAVREKEKVQNGGITIFNQCQQFVFTFSVEFIGPYSRNQAHRTQLWFDSPEGTRILEASGFELQRISGVRALHEFIQGGSKWERRAQMDIDILAMLEQRPEDRVQAARVETVCVTSIVREGVESTLEINRRA